MLLHLLCHHLHPALQSPGLASLPADVSSASISDLFFLRLLADNLFSYVCCSTNSPWLGGYKAFSFLTVTLSVFSRFLLLPFPLALACFAIYFYLCFPTAAVRDSFSYVSYIYFPTAAGPHSIFLHLLCQHFHPEEESGGRACLSVQVSRGTKLLLPSVPCLFFFYISFYCRHTIHVPTFAVS